MPPSPRRDSIRYEPSCVPNSTAIGLHSTAPPPSVIRKRDIVERRSKKGKTFYGCNRWPECNFVAWGKPIAEKCPECGSPYMVEKWLKAGAVWQCPNPECKHKQEAPPAA